MEIFNAVSKLSIEACVRPITSIVWVLHSPLARARAIFPFPTKVMDLDITHTLKVGSNRFGNTEIRTVIDNDLCHRLVIGIENQRGNKIDG